MVAFQCVHQFFKEMGASGEAVSHSEHVGTDKSAKQKAETLKHPSPA